MFEGTIGPENVSKMTDAEMMSLCPNKFLRFYTEDDSVCFATYGDDNLFLIVDRFQTVKCQLFGESYRVTNLRYEETISIPILELPGEGWWYIEQRLAMWYLNKDNDRFYNCSLTNA